MVLLVLFAKFRQILRQLWKTTSVFNQNCAAFCLRRGIDPQVSPELAPNVESVAALEPQVPAEVAEQSELLRHEDLAGSAGGARGVAIADGGPPRPPSPPRSPPRRPTAPQLVRRCPRWRRGRRAGGRGATREAWKVPTPYPGVRRGPRAAGRLAGRFFRRSPCGVSQAFRRYGSAGSRGAALDPGKVPDDVPLQRRS